MDIAFKYNNSGCENKLKNKMKEEEEEKLIPDGKSNQPKMMR